MSSESVAGAAARPPPQRGAGAAARPPPQRGAGAAARFGSGSTATPRPSSSARRA